MSVTKRRIALVLALTAWIMSTAVHMAASGDFRPLQPSSRPLTRFEADAIASFKAGGPGFFSRLDRVGPLWVWRPAFDSFDRLARLWRRLGASPRCPPGAAIYWRPCEDDGEQPQGSAA